MRSSDRMRRSRTSKLLTTAVFSPAVHTHRGIGTGTLNHSHTNKRSALGAWASGGTTTRQEGASRQACPGPTANNDSQQPQEQASAQAGRQQGRGQAAVRACCPDALNALCRSGGHTIGVTPAGRCNWMQSTAAVTRHV